MAQILEIIKNPINAIEKKFDGKVQKALIYLGIIVGVLLVASLLSTMYSTLMASKSYWTDNKVDWNSLKDINYIIKTSKKSIKKNSFHYSVLRDSTGFLFDAILAGI